MLSDFNKEPLLFCFIGPGASGKSSICTALASNKDLPLLLSVSSTTRTSRAYEKEGREYYFLTKEQFENRKKEDLFLEYAEFAGNLYGTEKKNLESARNLGKHLLLDIEIQGVKQLKEKLSNRVIVVFICPPSIEDLRDRFITRGSDSPERIEERIRLARDEIKIALTGNFSNYVIINDSLDKSVLNSQGLILGELNRRERLSDEVLARFNVR